MTQQAQAQQVTRVPTTPAVPTTTQQAPPQQTLPKPPLPSPPPLSPPPPPLQDWARQAGTPSSLQRLGFSRATTGLAPRIIIDVSGLEKSGKTRLALTSTAPIWYFCFDPINIEGVVEEFARTGKPVYLYNLEYRTGGDAPYYQGVYGQFISALDLVLQESRGTVVLDTGKQVEELVRLELFGKLKGVGTFSYEQRNAEMEALFQKLARGKLSVVWLHNLKRVWGQYTDKEGNIRSMPTGEWEPDRFDLVAQRVQMNARTRRDYDPASGTYGQFHFYMSNCRLKSELAGLEWTVPWGDMAFLPWLMGQVFNRPMEEFL